MALFKISKGLAANLPTTYNEGYCYFTTDDGKFYIDTTNAASGRVVLNANMADYLKTGSDFFRKGISIPNNADLDTYYTIGKYFCGSEDSAKTLLNCPTSSNFTLLRSLYGLAICNNF